MKNYFLPLGILVVLAAFAAGAWYMFDAKDEAEPSTMVVSEERREECMNFMMVAQFPTGGAADEFLSACLRGEPVLPHETGEEEPSSETSSPVSSVGPGCAVGGCSSQICGEAGEVEDMASTCEYREEYACYQVARCEKQSTGSCGWTETDEYNQCMANIGTGMQLQVY